MDQFQITYRGMDHSPALDAKIREHTAKLLNSHPEITMCHVIVDEGDRHRSKGNHFEVRLDLHVPGREIAASRKEHEDPYVAVHQAFEVAQRQLDEELERKRRKVKRHEGDDHTRP